MCVCVGGGEGGGRVGGGEGGMGWERGELCVRGGDTGDMIGSVHMYLPYGSSTSHPLQGWWVSKQLVLPLDAVVAGA